MNAIPATPAALAGLLRAKATAENELRTMRRINYAFKRGRRAFIRRGFAAADFERFTAAIKRNPEYCACEDPRRAKNAFLENLRLRYWRALFDTGEFSRRLTSNVLSDLHSRIGEFSRYEFSLFNIYELYIELGNSIIDNIKETIIKLFDEFTARHSWAEYSSNVLHYNGWKTNDAFKINKKVVIPMSGSFNWYDGCFAPDYQVARKLRDIEKTFDYLAGSLNSDHGEIEQILKAAEKDNQRRNVAFKHFSASFFKKGTCHLVFNDADLVKKMNVFAGQRKNWLPPGYGTTAYGDLEPEAREAVKSFDGGEVGYTHTVANREYFLFKPEKSVLRLECAATPA